MSSPPPTIINYQLSEFLRILLDFSLNILYNSAIIITFDQLSLQI